MQPTDLAADTEPRALRQPVALTPSSRALAALLRGTRAVTAVAVACAALAFTSGCGNETETKDKDTAVADAQDGSELDGSVDVDQDGGDEDSGEADAGDDSNVTPSSVLTARSLQFSEDFHGVWGAAPDDVWWVGAKGRVLHDNGKALAPRDSGTTKDLHAVWGRSSNEVWIAGDGVLLLWNGSKIVDRTPKELGGVSLRALHGPPDGSTVLVAGDDGVIWRLVEGEWMKETTNSGLKLRSLRAISAGNVWAIGDSGQGLRLNGGDWSSFSMPGASDTLYALDASKSGKLMACGAAGFLATTEDKTWTATLSNDPKDRDLYAMWTLSDTSAFAVGKDGAVIELQGSKWGLRDLVDSTYMKTATFRAIWGQVSKSGDIVGFAVGDDGAGLRYDGQADKWLDKRAETAAHLLSVRKLSGGALVAVGGGGLLLKAADASAPFVDLGVNVTGVDLLDACDDGAGGLWAVGANGVVVHVDAKGVATVETPAAASGLQLHAVAMVGGAPVAVGTGGVALRKGSTGWQGETTGVQFDLEGLSSDGTIAIAVGAFGSVLRRDANGSWTKESSGTSTPLHRVVVWGGGEAAAVGDNGLILLRDAKGAWTVGFEQPDLFLYGVDRYSDGRIVAVGWQGSVVVGKPGAFKVRTSGVPNVLRAVATDGDKAVAVGHKGGVYQVSEGM